MKAWDYGHPPRGTCVPTCPAYGVCHCGCGGRTWICTASSTREGRVKGQPATFCHGHSPRTHATPGCNTTTGIPVERLQPLVDWAVERYGSFRAAGVASGIPASTLKNWWRGTTKKANRFKARKLVEFVTAHKTPMDPYATFDPNRRLAGWAEGRARDEVQRDRKWDRGQKAGRTHRARRAS